MVTVRAPEERKLASPENDLDELVPNISTAIEKTRQLYKHTSVYTLSMVLVEAKADDSPDGGSER
jgi:hypothetical protein